MGVYTQYVSDHKVVCVVVAVNIHKGCVHVYGWHLEQVEWGGGWGMPLEAMWKMLSAESCVSLHHCLKPCT